MKVNDETEENKDSNDVTISGQGQYGCILHRGVKCDLKTPESGKYISKIQNNDNTFSNELKISEIVRQIPVYSTKFAPILSSCPIDIASLKPDSKIQSCKVIHNDDSNKKSFSLSKIRYVGEMNLGEYLQMLGDKGHITSIIDSQLYLLESIWELNEKSVVHFDLKSNNVMYDPVLNVPVIIDFGLSFQRDVPNVWEEFIIYDDEYIPWPVDVFVIAQIRRLGSGSGSGSNSIVQSEDFSNMIDLFLKTHFTHLFPESTELIKKTYLDYFSQFSGKKSVEIINVLMKNAQTWDLYSLVMIYYMAFADNKVLVDYVQFLKSFFVLSPDRRPSIADFKNQLFVFANQMKQ